MSTFYNVGICQHMDGKTEQVHGVSIEIPGPASDCKFRINGDVSWPEVSMMQTQLTHALRNMSDRAKARDPIGDHIAFVDWELKYNSLEIRNDEMKALLMRAADMDDRPGEIREYLERMDAP